MNISLGLMLGANMPGTPAAWTPASLTNLTAAPIVSLMLAQGKLWQDSAKTIPAVADGDLVRAAVCSFTGTEWTSDNDLARVTLKISGGKSWFEFNGLTTNLISPITRAQPVAFACAFISTGLNGRLLDANDGASNRIIFDCETASFGPNYELFAGTALGGGTIDDLQHTMLGVFNGASSSMRIDDTEIAAGNAGVAGSGTNIIIGGPVAGAVNLTGRIYGWTISDPPVDATERLNLNAFMAALS